MKQGCYNKRFRASPSRRLNEPVLGKRPRKKRTEPKPLAQKKGWAAFPFGKTAIRFEKGDESICFRMRARSALAVASPLIKVSSKEGRLRNPIKEELRLLRLFREEIEKNIGWDFKRTVFIDPESGRIKPLA